MMDFGPTIPGIFWACLLEGIQYVAGAAMLLQIIHYRFFLSLFLSIVFFLLSLSLFVCSFVCV